MQLSEWFYPTENRNILLNYSNHFNISYTLYIIFFYFFFTSLSFSQSDKENWVPVATQNQNKIYINTTGLSKYKGEDIYVWVLEENEPPITMEGIDLKIYKTKTYFLLNKVLKRYSIHQIIFYDNKKNVIKSYNYQINSDNQDYKYSSPILEGSNVFQVLLKCVEIIKSTK
ncbi:MAG TPA: hypothetical protein PLZ15_09145 [Melioribacteraceae bacterium]|nr:hypothetical protein [Melioribacteraceae bacterium]